MVCHTNHIGPSGRPVRLIGVSARRPYVPASSAARDQYRFSMSSLAAQPAIKPAETRSVVSRRSDTGVAIAWTPPDSMEYRDWVVAGRRLGEMGRISNWWVGDWLRYGSTRWGEKYVKAAKITGFDGKTLRNIAYVASRFDLSRRRDDLTWSHHAEVAALDAAQQDKWLDRAVRLSLSARDLRVEIRGSRRPARETTAPGEESRTGPAPETTVLCPHCGNAVPIHSPAREQVQP